MAPSEPAADEQINPAAASAAPRSANMLAHISVRGDVPGFDGEWLGEPGSPHAIEAIMLAPAGKGPPQVNPAPEYQIIYSDRLRTPWVPAGQPCGSRGYSLAVRGIRFRLSAETASFFDCRYDLAFTDGSQLADLPGTEIALAPEGAKLAAIRLRITSRPGVPLIVLNDIDVSEPLPWPELGGPEDPFLRLSLLSPAFDATAPLIRNGALIPAEVWSALHRSFRRTVFPSRTVVLREVEDATIVSPGLVFDRNLDLVPVSDHKPTAEAVTKGRAAAAASRTGAAPQIDGLSLLCQAHTPQNYGSLMIEALSAAWLAQAAIGSQLTTFVFQDSPLIDLMREALQGAGIIPTALAILDDRPLHCKRLILVEGLTDQGLYQSPLCLAPLQQMAASVPAGPSQKLFISYADQKHPLLNQDAVEVALRAQGFTIVELDQMTLRERIALFKGSACVVGPIGAGLTNIAFCAPGTRVVALGARSWTDNALWFLAQHAGLPYEEVRGKDAADGSIQDRPWEAGFSLSDDDIAYLTTL
ncbi:glycosyltransferase family 61 protein [Acidisoma cellulosilytica]|uniref:Glycosyltransferase family 61 protein n=1 Tax=Acidisoma cellulosilyticum TaxID=2802395 RepID=A0A964E3U8_9PROT|nr:glycosyltransferase family 61 protein [Acidisoma cellulosilyticum]MCB8880771.1 glycosyltransferase family 61 protein [Acidisoma cellulosilyticum]